MSLPLAQLQALKAEILADGVLAAQPNTPDGNFAIADALNALAAPAFAVWRSNVPVKDVFDAINWALYTPVDAPDGTGVHQERLLIIQTKQMNLQNMLIGRDAIDAGKANIRAGLRDAVIQVPAGASGAAVAPGGASGATVLNALTRSATRAEKVLATPNQTTGAVSAGLLNFEGKVSYLDVEAARAS
jgi:hypothetical protein